MSGLTQPVDNLTNEEALEKIREATETMEEWVFLAATPDEGVIVYSHDDLRGAIDMLQEYLMFVLVDGDTRPLPTGLWDHVLKDVPEGAKEFDPDGT